MKRLFASLLLAATLCPFCLLLAPLAFADTQIFSDDFLITGTANVNLNVHTPDVGTGYTKIISNDTAGDQMIAGWINDRLEAGSCSTNEGAGYTLDATYSSADYHVQITMTNGDNGDDYNWLGVRVQDASNGYWLRFNNGALGTKPQLFEVTAGSWASLGSASATDIADGSVVKLEIIGTALKVYDDGVEIISTTDATLSSAGKAGVGMGDLTNNGVDDCSSQSLDDLSVTLIESAVAEAPTFTPKVISIF